MRLVRQTAPWEGETARSATGVAVLWLVFYLAVLVF